jgi:hypothetical protein
MRATHGKEFENLSLRGDFMRKRSAFWNVAMSHAPRPIFARTSLQLCVAHLKRRLSRESWLNAVQPISFMSRSISVRKSKQRQSFDEALLP